MNTFSESCGCTDLGFGNNDTTTTTTTNNKKKNGCLSALYLSALSSVCDGAQGGYKSMGGGVGELHNNYIKLMIRYCRDNQNAQSEYILQEHTHTHTGTSTHTHARALIHTVPLTHNLHRSALSLLGCCIMPCVRDGFLKICFELS